MFSISRRGVKTRSHHSSPLSTPLSFVNANLQGSGQDIRARVLLKRILSFLIRTSLHGVDSMLVNSSIAVVLTVILMNLTCTNK